MSATFITDAEMDTISNILDGVRRERVKQLEKWGQQNHDPVFWTVIETEELGEVARAAFEHRKSTTFGGEQHWLQEYRKEMVQVAAVAVAAIESLDRNELRAS